MREREDGARSNQTHKHKMVQREIGQRCEMDNDDRERGMRECSKWRERKIAGTDAM